MPIFDVVRTVLESVYEHDRESMW